MLARRLLRSGGSPSDCLAFESRRLSLGLRPIASPGDEWCRTTRRIVCGASRFFSGGRSPGVQLRAWSAWGDDQPHEQWGDWGNVHTSCYRAGLAYPRKVRGKP